MFYLLASLFMNIFKIHNIFIKSYQVYQIFVSSYQIILDYVQDIARYEYSVIQSDGNSFCGDVVSNNFSKTPHISTYLTEKQTPTLSQEFCMGREQFEVISNSHIILARGSESIFQWDTQICVRSSTGTAGSLRIPETRRTPLYVFPFVKRLSY